MDARDPQNWIPRELFAAYVGARSEDLLAYYDKARSKNNLITWSFNLLAVLALPAWLGLRRQWAMWCTFTGLIGVVPFIERALGFELPPSAFVGTSVAMGFMARGLLLTSANAHYLKLKRQGVTESALREALKDRASRNVPFAIAGGVGCVGVIFTLDLLARLLSGGR
jgi:hypothetical protein